MFCSLAEVLNRVYPCFIRIITFEVLFLYYLQNMFILLYYHEFSLWFLGWIITLFSYITQKIMEREREKKKSDIL